VAVAIEHPIAVCELRDLDDVVETLLHGEQPLPGTLPEPFERGQGLGDERVGGLVHPQREPRHEEAERDPEHRGRAPSDRLAVSIEQDPAGRAHEPDGRGHREQGRGALHAGARQEQEPDEERVYHVAQRVAQVEEPRAPADVTGHRLHDGVGQRVGEPQRDRGQEHLRGDDAEVEPELEPLRTPPGRGEEGGLRGLNLREGGGRVGSRQPIQHRDGERGLRTRVERDRLAQHAA
jgi:hypothetical protein